MGNRFYTTVIRTETHKQCAGCKEVKLRTEYTKNRARKDGLQDYCKPCSVASVRAYHKRHPEKHAAYNREWDRRNPEKKKDTQLKTRLGLDSGAYNAMLAAQDGKCAICLVPAGHRRLAVDHCHDTGRVRGLLCDSCNNGLGRFKHDPERIRVAIEYLKQYHPSPE